MPTVLKQNLLILNPVSYVVKIRTNSHCHFCQNVNIATHVIARILQQTEIKPKTGCTDARPRLRLG